MLAVDISHWSDVVDFAALKLGGVDLCIPKLTQGNYLLDSEVDEYISQMRKVGMPFGVFHYDDPDISVFRQVDWIKKFMPEDAKFLALDIEKIGPRKGQKYNSITLAAHIKILYDECAKVFPRLMVYTRMSYITSYCPTLLTWLRTKRNWLAAYPELRTVNERLLGKKGIRISWDELRRRMAKMPSGPIVPYGVNCALWQFTGDMFVLPGCRKTLDVNLYKGTLDEFLKLF